jgi:hypothetical protein
MFVLIKVYGYELVYNYFLFLVYFEVKIVILSNMINYDKLLKKLVNFWFKFLIKFKKTELLNIYYIINELNVYILLMRVVFRTINNKLKGSNNRGHHNRNYSSRNDHTNDYKKSIKKKTKNFEKDNKTDKTDINKSYGKSSNHPIVTEIDRNVIEGNKLIMFSVNVTTKKKLIGIGNSKYKPVPVYKKEIEGKEVSTNLVPIIYKTKVDKSKFQNGEIIGETSKFDETITENDNDKIIEKVNELSEKGEMTVLDCDTGEKSKEGIEFTRNQSNDDFFNGIN